MAGRQRLATALLTILFVCTAFAPAYGDTRFTERIVVGGPDQFVEVRHIVIEGSNYFIGKKLGEFALRMGIQLRPGGDPLRNRVQREYLAANYRVLHQRMRGIANAYGLSLDDDSYDFSFISMLALGRPGCSGVFYPGTYTQSGHSILSRNYDFTTGTIMGRRPQGDELPVMSRPILFELYPDNGYASLSLCAFDMVGGVLDGVNSEGLVVAIFADDATLSEYERKPAQGIGMHELLGMRYLLDNCKDVAEAKEAMMRLKHYYSFIPCHYIICDSNGDSFVFEFPAIRNGYRIIDGEGPQCITNHLISDFEFGEELPTDSQLSTFDRYRKLKAATEDGETFDIDTMKAINFDVAVMGAFSHPEYAAGRTLWHALYDADERSLSVRFYLGEEAGTENIQYSDYITFKLD
jgi:hypothetical protein